MKKELALSLITALVLMLCDSPVISEPIYGDYTVYREYRDDLYSLQRDIALIYMELHQQKNPRAVYEHILQTTEKTALLIGEAESASRDVHDALQISVQDYMEILLRLGISEKQKESLVVLGYTEDDIDKLLTWLLYYNDYYHHAVSGFTPEEIEWFYSMGLTDEQIAELQTIMEEHYAQLHTAQQMVKQHQKELLYVQVSLSIAASRTLLELSEKGKSKSELQDAEEKLLQAICSVSEDQSSLEHVKAFSKQVYKAAEQKIRKGEEQYLVDFFVGLQVHCGALTALNGDPAFGLKVIQSYERVVSECVASPERPSPSLPQTDGQPTSLKDTVPITDFVGQVEEFDETNNMGMTVLFVKASDTNLWQAIALLVGFITTHFGQVEFSLQSVVEFLTAGITATTIVIGTVGAFFLLVVTAPTIGYEWPPAVPGWIEGDQVIIIVEGSYGQGHIEERAKSKEPCIASSHQAILDDKYMIQEIVVHALKLLYNENTGQYIYYYVHSGKEWGVFVEEYENRYYQLITAYRADCSPFKCEGKEFNTVLEKWICEGFKLISFW